MAFSLSSTDVKLDGTHLKALCKDRFGNYHVSAIELDHYIVNIDGILAWQPIGDFGKSSRHIGLDGSVLKCQSQTWDGEWRDTWINIDEKISNYNGKLIYKFEHAIIKVDEGNKHEVMNYIDDIYKAHKTTVHAQAAEMKGGSKVLFINAGAGKDEGIMLQMSAEASAAIFHYVGERTGIETVALDVLQTKVKAWASTGGLGIGLSANLVHATGSGSGWTLESV